MLAVAWNVERCAIRNEVECGLGNGMRLSV